MVLLLVEGAVGGRAVCIVILISVDTIVAPNASYIGVGGMSRKALNAPRQGSAVNGVIDFGACAGAMTNVMP